MTRYFLVVAEDGADMDVDDVAEAIYAAGYRRSVRSGARHEFDVAEAHHVQQLGQMNVHTFAAEIDLTEG